MNFSVCGRDNIKFYFTYATSKSIFIWFDRNIMSKFFGQEAVVFLSLMLLKFHMLLYKGRNG